MNDDGRRLIGHSSYAATADEDDADTISLTSTVHDEFPPDMEFAVEDVHAERYHEDGVGPKTRQLLIAWTNFPEHERTWEPVENIPADVKEMWETKKAKQDPSVAIELVREHNKMLDEMLQKSRQRHRLRNAKRRRLGIATTNFRFKGVRYPDSDDDTDRVDESADSEQYQDSDTSDDDSTEAMEDDEIDHKAADALLLAQPTKKRPQRANRIFNCNPDVALPSRARPKKASSAKDRGPSVPGTRRTSAKESRSTALPESKVNRRPSRQGELPSTTGYQGSARKTEPSTTKKVSLLPTRAANASTAEPAPSPVIARPGVAKKVMLARKTAPAPKVSAPNVFIGGKKRKQREAFENAIINPEKGSRIFDKASQRRRAELRARERSDKGPEIDMVAAALFRPGSDINHSIQQNSSRPDDDESLFVNEGGEETQKKSKVMLPSKPDEPVRTASAPKPALSMPKRVSFGAEPTRTKKKAKSVRFGGEDSFPPIATSTVRYTEDDLVSEPMDIEETRGPPEAFLSQQSPSTNAQLSLRTHRIRNTRSVGKKIVLSTAQDRDIDTIFDGIPVEPLHEAIQQRIEAFVTAECLHFGHIFLAESLVHQLKKPGSPDTLVVCSGTITSVNNAESLENIAGHLRIGKSALLSSHEQFNVVAFPTRCELSLGEILGPEAGSPDGVVLRYMVIQSLNVSRVIRPSLDTSKGSQVLVGTEKTLLLSRCFGMAYSLLVTMARSRDHSTEKEHHFFLAFPELAIDWYRSLASWLYLRNKECKIYACFRSGSWAAFLERAREHHGIVIVHEAVIPFLRQFPFTAEILQSKVNFNFWCFSESVDDSRQMDPSTHFAVDSVVPTMFSPIFPYGYAILVTPSFIVSQPQQALELFKWFFGKKAKSFDSTTNKLVTAYDILGYLRDLSAEKCAQQMKLNTSLKGLGTSEMDRAQSYAAVSDPDLQAMQKSWLHLDDWLAPQIERAGPFSDDNHVIFADRSIDPNDEQSLVNWFGWWSLAKVSKHRKFYVLGSSSSIKEACPPGLTMSSRASRTIKIPKFSRSVVNDPDEAVRPAMSTKDEPSSVEAKGVGPKSGDRNVPSLRYGFPSQFFENSFYNLRSYLERTYLENQGGFFRVNKFPISWIDLEMADHFGASTTESSTIKQWFNWPWAWLSGGSFNTYLAFFHTIREEWNPSNFTKGVMPARHPWLVIYRPFEPHKKEDRYRHGKNELIIWDVRAGNELEHKRDLSLADLTWMQRELVRYVQTNCHVKTPGSQLIRVYLGGFKKQVEACRDMLPIDQTTWFLEQIINNFRWAIPSTEVYLVQNGFRKVALSLDAEAVSSATPVTDDSASEMHRGDDEERIIFHPPRSPDEFCTKGQSRCRNDLYEAARLTRVRSPAASQMQFTFRPTMEWYKDQVNEGRQFEHILVDEWEKVFEKLGVGGRGKAPMSATSATAPTPWRKDSTASSHSSPRS